MMTIYKSDCLGQPGNCIYLHRIDITDAQSLSEAVSRDYVCAQYRDNYRSNDNFIRSNCLAVEFDNDHSDDLKQWVTPEKLLEVFPGVTVGIHFSRNHMKQKNGKTARPKFHAFFEIEETTDANKYSALKHKVASIYPFVDTKALDAARFFFGTQEPEVEFFDGGMTLDELFSQKEFADVARLEAGSEQRVIEEGRRNATLSRSAGRILKRFGCTQQAFKIFLDEASHCEPPLEDRELGTIWKSALRFARKVQSQEGYIPPEQYRGEYTLKPMDYSDIGQAKVVATDCAAELAYSTATDFLIYDGRRWVESKPKALGCVENFLDRQLSDAMEAVRKAKDELLRLGVSKQAIAAGAKAIAKELQGKEQEKAYDAFLAAKAYLAFVMQRRDVKYINNAMTAARPMLEVEPRELDSHEFYINCPDGTYDLRKGLDGRHDHDPADYITMITSVSPSEEGKAIWLETLDRIFQGDEELIEYVQKIVGLCAIGEVYQEAITISYGDGSNGKSTFWNTIAGVLGNYSGMISADALTVGCRRNVKPELAEIKGKRILIAAELEEGMRLSTSIVKQLSSTDEIEGEKKYHAPFKFKPSHTLILYTNHLPRVGAMDTGIWRRLIVIPFNATISGNSEIKNYSKFLMDNAGPYIMKWIIEGAKKVIDCAFKLELPLCVRQAIERYKADSDWMSHFLEDCCVIDRKVKEKSGELYSAYRAYSLRTGEFARSTSEFYEALDRQGFVRHKTMNGAYVMGLKLSDSEAEF